VNIYILIVHQEIAISIKIRDSSLFILEEKMKILLFIGIALLILLVLFLWSACALSSKISREEEMIESEK
jgi:hypothetical protein